MGLPFLGQGDTLRMPMIVTQNTPFWGSAVEQAETTADERGLLPIDSTLCLMDQDIP